MGYCNTQAVGNYRSRKSSGRATKDGLFATHKDNECRDFVIDIKEIVFDPLFHVHHVTLRNCIPLAANVNLSGTGNNEIECFVGSVHGA